MQEIQPIAARLTQIKDCRPELFHTAFEDFEPGLARLSASLSVGVGGARERTLFFCRIR
jgi:hypothetical protein